MKTSRIILAMFISLLTIAFVSSCNKDEVKSEVANAELNDHGNEKGNVGIGNACNFTVPQTGSCFPGIYTNSISLPQYPGCTFQIKALYEFCYSGATISAYHFRDFEIIDHDCGKFQIDLQNAKNNGTLQSFIIGFNASVWATITQILLNAAPSNQSGLEFEYIIASCRRTCYIEKWKGEMSILIPVDENCSNGCCRRLTGYTRVGGKWQRTAQYVTPWSEDINGCQPPSTTQCNSGVGTDCFPRCETLLQF
jgi:hypothetical protein